MERKTARISKEPKARRQEILDTAMKVFVEKGYEAATMRDIASDMHVALGLCYRYFESKQVLYEAAVKQYVSDIAEPVILLLGQEEDTLKAFLDKMEQLFCRTDGMEKYHHFYHKKENHDLQMLMSMKLCERIQPYLEKKLESLNDKGLTDVKNVPLTASYLLFGAAPVIENDAFTSEEKSEMIRMSAEKLLSI